MAATNISNIFSSANFMTISSAYYGTAPLNCASIIISALILLKSYFPQIGLPSSPSPESDNTSDKPRNSPVPAKLNRMKILGRIANIYSICTNLIALIRALPFLGLDTLTSTSALANKCYYGLMSLSIPLSLYFLFLILFETLKIFTVLDARLTFEQAFNRISYMYQISLYATAFTTFATTTSAIIMVFLPGWNLVIFSILNGNLALFLLLGLVFCLYQSVYLIHLIYVYHWTPASRWISYWILVVTFIFCLITTTLLTSVLYLAQTQTQSSLWIVYTLYAVSVVIIHAIQTALFYVFDLSKDFALHLDTTPRAAHLTSEEVEGPEGNSKPVMLLDVIPHRYTLSPKSKHARTTIALQTVKPNFSLRMS